MTSNTPPPSALSGIWRSVRATRWAKLRHLLRHQQVIRAKSLVATEEGTRWINLTEYLEFIGTKGQLQQHTFVDYPPCGVYSLVEPDGDPQKFHIVFRIEPNTPSVGHVRRGVPCVVIESVVVQSSASGDFVSMPL